jgi:hypothetical protein
VFPNATIPQRVWSAPAQHLLQYIPLPNVGTNTFSTGAQAETVRDDKASFRVDQNSERFGLFTAYYFVDDFNLNNPSPTGQGGASVPGFNALNLGRGQLITVGHTKTFGATLVNEARLSFMRSSNTVGQPVGGVGPSLASQVFETRSRDDGNCAASASNRGRGERDFQFLRDGHADHKSEASEQYLGLSDNLSKVWRAHTFKLGFQGSYEQINVNPNATYNGSFLFAGNETGLDFADFLIGVASNYNQADSETYYERHKYAAGFAQDSWRARPNLTINYGVRWDLMQYWYEKYNQMPTFSLGQQSQVFRRRHWGWFIRPTPGFRALWFPNRTSFLRAWASPGLRGNRMDCWGRFLPEQAIRAFDWDMAFSIRWCRASRLHSTCRSLRTALATLAPARPCSRHPLLPLQTTLCGESLSLELSFAEYQPRLERGLLGLRADRRCDGTESSQYVSLQRELLPFGRTPIRSEHAIERFLCWFAGPSFVVDVLSKPLESCPLPGVEQSECGCAWIGDV